MFTFTTRSRPAFRSATFSSSGATARQGPHHGAPVVETTGNAVEATRASKTAADATSTVEVGAGMAVLALRASVLVAELVEVKAILGAA